MTHQEIKNKISEKGYITLKELRGLYQGEELLNINLNYLVSKNTIRQISYLSDKGKDILYYIPKESL